MMSNRVRLRTIMRRRKLDSPQVAKLLGVAANTVRKWRCGLRATPDYAIVKLSEAI